MEESNVNNLNGIGNFGHGFQDEVEEIGTPMTEEESEEATPAEEPEEEVEINNPETE